MSSNYTASAIEVLTGLEPVRKRPGMYTETDRPNHLAHEVIDNSVDEAIAGHARRAWRNSKKPSAKRPGAFDQVRCERLWRTLTGRSEAGWDTSNIVSPTSSRPWTDGFADGCEPSNAEGTKERDVPGDKTINAGPMPTSPNSG